MVWNQSITANFRQCIEPSRWKMMIRPSWFDREVTKLNQEPWKRCMKTALRGYVVLKEIMSENLTSPVKCFYLPLRCQSQVNFITAVLLLPFFWRKGYSSDAANTPSFPTRPVNDRDRALLFTTYILSTMTSLTAIDSTSATERRIAPFHALKDSSSGRKQFAFCFALFVFT